MSKVNCFGCNVEKDLSVDEMYPYTEDSLSDEPGTPILILDVQGPQIPNDPNNYSEFRQTRVCYECFHKLDPDMWIGKSCWDNISPHVPYDKLPLYDDKLSDPSQMKSL